jgi:transaldolase
VTEALNVSIKIFADGADLEAIAKLSESPLIKGFTTNPTLMRKAGVADYRAFAHAVLGVVGDKPVSFEVFADDFEGMREQALEIGRWGPNVNVKIPVTNTEGVSSEPLIAALSRKGVALNVTAVFTLDQVRGIAATLDPAVPAIVSVFAGRIADTGRDPIPLMRAAKAALRDRPRAELLWASPRELLNVFHAQEADADIITMTPDMLAKLEFVGKNLAEFSRETVEMFYRDAQAAAYSIELPRRAAAVA